MTTTTANGTVANPIFVVLDPLTGAHLRQATGQEEAEFRAANVFPWDRPMTVSNGALVDVCTGYGANYSDLPLNY